MRHATWLAALPCLAPVLVAQTPIVSPAVFTTIEGPSANTHPIGPTIATSPSMRYQQVHDDVTQAGVIREMGFRLNGGAASVATSIVMEVLLSTAAVTSATSTTTFATNHGADLTSVVPANSQFNYPAQPATVRGPVPAVYRVPFTTPFPFAGVGSLCWEMRIASRTNTTAFSLDAAAGAFTLSTQALGTGCLATGRTAVATTTASLSGANLTVSGANLTPSSVGLAVVGFNDVQWFGIPLPLLIPGSDLGPSGPCNIWSPLDLLQSFATSATGGGSAVIAAVPASPQWLGLRVYSWAFSLDATANSTGIVSTNYRELNWGNAVISPATRVYAFNNVGALTGSRDTTGLVTEFVF